MLLLLMRVPISFAMLLATLGSALVTGTNFSVLVRQMVDGANNFSLLSIPFFIVMGEFMSAGGISEKIVDLANLAVGRGPRRGGAGGGGSPPPPPGSWRRADIFIIVVHPSQKVKEISRLWRNSLFSSKGWDKTGGFHGAFAPRGVKK